MCRAYATDKLSQSGGLSRSGDLRDGKLFYGVPKLAPKSACATLAARINM